MMHSKRSQEGHLLIDNRESPGVPDALLRTISPALPPGAGTGLFEAPTITCSHCQTVLILNPLRSRERAYCQKCDHYICDGCGAAMAASGVCKPFVQIIEEVQEQAAKNGPLIITP